MSIFSRQFNPGENLTDEQLPLTTPRVKLNLQSESKTQEEFRIIILVNSPEKLTPPWCHS